MMPSASCLPTEDPFQIEDELIVPGTLGNAPSIAMLEQWGLSDAPPIPLVDVLVHEDPFQTSIATYSGEQEAELDPERPSAVLRLSDPEVESASRGSQIDPWVDETVDRLGEIAELAPGWDGHGSDPPQGAYIVEAATFLASVMRPETPAPSIVPTSDGGLQLEWHRAGLDVEVLFSPEEDNSIYIHERASGSEREVPAIGGFLEFDLGRRLVG